MTDVVLPRVSGRELAARLAIHRPAIKVLYVSGTSDGAIARHRMLEPGIEFLEKPFSLDRLCSKVRQILGVDLSTEDATPWAQRSAGLIEASRPSGWPSPPRVAGLLALVLLVAAGRAAAAAPPGPAAGGRGPRPAAHRHRHHARRRHRLRHGAAAHLRQSGLRAAHRLSRRGPPGPGIPSVHPPRGPARAHRRVGAARPGRLAARPGVPGGHPHRPGPLVLQLLGAAAGRVGPADRLPGHRVRHHRAQAGRGGDAARHRAVPGGDRSAAGGGGGGPRLRRPSCG